MLKPVWIEIPVKDIDRALAFYQAVFELDATEIGDDGVRRTVTLSQSSESEAPGISLNQTANFEPSDKGVLIYFDTGGNINDVLPRVEPAGGRVTTPKTSMGESGYYALIVDTEGNTLALWDYISE